MNTTAQPLTLIEQRELQDYIAAMQVLSSIEPQFSPTDIGAADAWDEWNSRCMKLTEKYSAVVRKALVYCLGNIDGGHPKSIATLLSAFFTDDGQLHQPTRFGQMSIFPEDEKQNYLQIEMFKALPHLQSIIPQKHLIPNNKLANSLTKDIIDAGAIDLIVANVGRKEITTRCILSYDGENVKLSSRQPFTEYDRNVADAVTSLFEYGDSSHIVTAATVYRAMVHATASECPSPQQIGAVTKSLDKLRFVRVQVDCTEELKRRNISLNGSQITGGKIDTYLLMLEKLEVSAGGKKISAYKIVKPPILYDYSRLTGQVITVPATLLDIRDKNGAKVANTERRIAIKGYLMRRISVMKGKTGKKQSRQILYETLFSEVCEKEPNKKEKQAIREYIDLVLQSWTAKHFIKGYHSITSGRNYTSIEIIL